MTRGFASVGMKLNMVIPPDAKKEIIDAAEQKLFEDSRGISIRSGNRW